MRLRGLYWLLAIIVIASAIPASARTEGSYLATEFVQIYRQTSDSTVNWNREYWQAFAGELEGDFSPAYTSLEILPPSSSGPYVFTENTYDDEWETGEITEDFGNPVNSPVVFNAYDQGMLVGNATWQTPQGMQPVEPEAAPQIVAGPAGSYWQNDVLKVQQTPISLSFNVGAFQSFGLTPFDEIFVWLECENGCEEYDFSTLNDFEDYDPITGIATVTFNSTRVAGRTYAGQAGYSTVNLLNGIGSTEGALDGYLLAAVFDNWTEFNVEVVPEPSTILALAGGLASLGGILRRRTH